ILTNSCNRYPDLRSLNSKLSSLYAARLYGSVGSLGDTQFVELSVKTIDTRYALDGEDTMGEGVRVLLDCLFAPLTENGAFKENVVVTEKQSCIDQIEAELNDKRLYAMRQAIRLLCKGEPAANAAHGTIDGITAVTPESAYKAYKNLLKTARVEIICVGCNDFVSAGEILQNEFAKIMRTRVEDCYSKPGALKSDVLESTEVMDVNQSKMVLGLKCDSSDREALAFMTKIYGGSATSKLFENVREKMSLCYYCWARFYDSKKLIMAECGVEKDNIDKAKAEILAQLDCMRKDDFTDTEVNHALLSLENDHKLINDSLSGIKTWYLSHIYNCDIITPEQAVARYAEVGKSRERIVNAAKSVKLDTVYVLTTSESEVQS
ncbi:MAG: insulinase family protein, partial [Oscillospiraceae bacterium]|nr:insulinase family protein [Oscillospiraceae bacterium]